MKHFRLIPNHNVILSPASFLCTFSPQNVRLLLLLSKLLSSVNITNKQNKKLLYRQRRTPRQSILEEEIDNRERARPADIRHEVTPIPIPIAAAGFLCPVKSNSQERT